MQFFVYSRAGIEAVPPHDAPHVVISITTPPDDLARLRTTPACRGVLRLSFLDADAPSNLHPASDLFSEAHAARVWAFVLHHRADIERIVVHCDAGLSRSPAVAAAISKALTGDDTEFFGGRYRPNMRVYRKLLEAYEGALRRGPSSFSDDGRPRDGEDLLAGDVLAARSPKSE